MQNNILVGRDQKMEEIPEATWLDHLGQVPQNGASRLNFMTPIHHQIRYFVVKELAYRQKPIEPGHKSEKLNIQLDKVIATLEELERKLFFLVRNEQGAVTWAYPVTVEITPHKIRFNSGERLYSA
jgi:hypothetical protein